MDQKVIQFYRGIFADLSVDHEEASELTDFFSGVNPPPDKLVSLRATAFKVGSEYLSEDRDTNVSILRCINAIVHALEKTCMMPRPFEDTSSFDQEKVTELYRQVYSDLSVDSEENQELMAFFGEENPPPVDQLVTTRANAFKIGCESLTDDPSTNLTLLRCINVIVHCFERTCFVPKPYTLQEEVSDEITVASIGLDASIEKAVQHLWDLDVNRLDPHDDYKLDVQGGKKPYHKYDGAEDPLFRFVDSRPLRRPTYQAFVALLDNYTAETGTAEHVSDSERREVWTFLKAIMQTAPMQFCHKYCRANKPDDVPADEQGFMNLLHKTWFELYHRSRGGRADSSGFEHVFVGEVKDGKVSGFHNWLMLYLEEKKGSLDYRGYIFPRGRNNAEVNEDDHILTVQFAWNGVEKAVGTSFIGVSPEFEMALYTTCFLVGQEENKVTLDTGHDEFELNIKCYKMARDKVGTSFPEALAHYD